MSASTQERIAAELEGRTIGRQKLYPSEVEVLQLVEGGASAREIADLLGLSVQTVRNRLVEARKVLKAQR